jgi:hypothetical protein
MDGCWWEERGRVIKRSGSEKIFSNFLNAGIIPSKIIGERRVTVLVQNRRSGLKNITF